MINIRSTTLVLALLTISTINAAVVQGNQVQGNQVIKPKYEPAELEEIYAKMLKTPYVQSMLHNTLNDRVLVVNLGDGKKSDDKKTDKPGRLERYAEKFVDLGCNSAFKAAEIITPWLMVYMLVSGTPILGPIAQVMAKLAETWAKILIGKRT